MDKLTHGRSESLINGTSPGALLLERSVRAFGRSTFRSMRRLPSKVQAAKLSQANIWRHPAGQATMALSIDEREILLNAWNRFVGRDRNVATLAELLHIIACTGVQCDHDHEMQLRTFADNRGFLAFPELLLMLEKWKAEHQQLKSDDVVNTELRMAYRSIAAACGTDQILVENLLSTMEKEFHLTVKRRELDLPTEVSGLHADAKLSASAQEVIDEPEFVRLFTPGKQRPSLWKRTINTMPRAGKPNVLDITDASPTTPYSPATFVELNQAPTPKSSQPSSVDANCSAARYFRKAWLPSITPKATNMELHGKLSTRSEQRPATRSSLNSRSKEHRRAVHTGREELSPPRSQSSLLPSHLLHTAANIQCVASTILNQLRNQQHV